MSGPGDLRLMPCSVMCLCVIHILGSEFFRQSTSRPSRGMYLMVQVMLPDHDCRVTLLPISMINLANIGETLYRVDILVFFSGLYFISCRIYWEKAGKSSDIIASGPPLVASLTNLTVSLLVSAPSVK